MKIENPAAFNFIFQDDVYLLNKDKTGFSKPNALAPHDPTTEAVSFNYLGGNKKNFLVVVHYPEKEFIAESHLEALQNILKRLEYHPDDIAIFNRANYAGVHFTDLMQYFNPQKLLLLGDTALPNGIERLALNVVTRVNNCNTLFSFSFDEMMNNVENKKAFWEKMKQL